MGHHQLVYFMVFQIVDVPLRHTLAQAVFADEHHTVAGALLSTVSQSGFSLSIHKLHTCILDNDGFTTVAALALARRTNLIIRVTRGLLLLFLRC